MNKPNTRIGVIVGAAALSCVSFAVTPAVHAATGGLDVTASGVYSDAGGNADTSACDVTTDTNHSTSDPLVPNAAPKAYSSRADIVAVAQSDATNTITASSRTSGTAQLRESGGNPTGLDLSFNSALTRKLSKATAPCSVAMGYDAGVEGLFTLTRPMIVTTDLVSHGRGQIQLVLAPTTSSAPIFTLFGAVMDWNNTPDTRAHRSFYLPAGTYHVMTTVSFEMDDATHANTTLTGRLSMAFGLPGARTAQQRPSSYVKMPGSQACGSNTIAAKITGKGKLAKRIKSVRFGGPGMKTTVIRHVSKGRVVNLHVSKDMPVDVTIRVRLKNTRVVNSAASYLQCS